MKKVIYLILLVLPGLNLAAQTVYKDQVRIENQSAVRDSANRLIVAMKIIMDKTMKVSSNNAAVLTPILEANGQTKALPAVLVYGRKRSLVERRNHVVPKDAYATVRRKRKTEQTVDYLVQVPYEKWMRKANLVMDADLCGCRNVVEANTLDPIATLNLAIPKPDVCLAYITPQEVSKERSVANRAFLDFPVNKTVIVPDYRNNETELAKIRAAIDSVRNNKYATITYIGIKGFASPEGLYQSNARLADGRSKALMKYVRDYYHFSQTILKVSSTPEDWDGFRQFVASSSMDKKEEVLQIMDNKQLDYDVKENTIRKLIGVDAYKYLLEQCYPTLRHSDYEVAYTIRPFDVEEVKSMMHTRPQYLSLKEIYVAAQTYEPGSEEFNEAFKIAATMFPNDAVANLNAAASEIQRGGDMTAAKKYLNKADQKQGATLNNWGAITLLEGDLTAAADYLKRAKAAGCPEADANQTELDKQLEY